MSELINLGNICGGTVIEVFDKTLLEVLKNISDPNTPCEQKRSLTIKFDFKPSKSREVGEVTCKVETKLAAIAPTAGNFFITRRMDGVRGYARDPKQDELFATEPAPTPKAQ